MVLVRGRGRQGLRKAHSPAVLITRCPVGENHIEGTHDLSSGLS